MAVPHPPVTGVPHLGGWRHPSSEKARPPTFQRFPHSLQTTKVVMGSSELRVCTCREGYGEGGHPQPQGLKSLGAGGPEVQVFP